MSQIKSAADLKSAPTAALVAFYNARTGKQIKKFSSRAAAEKQCAAVLPKAAGAPRPTPNGISTVVAQTAAAKAPKPTPTKTDAAPGLAADGVIRVLVEGNPKFRSAAERFALYRDGMRLSEYISAGGQRRDVTWDAKQGWISFTPDASAPAEPKAKKSAVAKDDAF